MSSPQELRINFRHSRVDYNLNLMKGAESDHSININTSAELDDKEKLESVRKILASVSLESISNSEDLKGRLSFLEDILFPPIQKANDLGTKTLGTRQEFHAWKKEEEENLPKTKNSGSNFLGKKRKYEKLAGNKRILGEREV